MIRCVVARCVFHCVVEIWFVLSCLFVMCVVLCCVVSRCDVSRGVVVVVVVVFVLRCVVLSCNLVLYVEILKCCSIVLVVFVFDLDYGCGCVFPCFVELCWCCVDLGYVMVCCVVMV